MGGWGGGGASAVSFASLSFRAAYSREDVYVSRGLEDDSSLPKHRAGLQIVFPTCDVKHNRSDAKAPPPTREESALSAGLSETQLVFFLSRDLELV